MSQDIDILNWGVRIGIQAKLDGFPRAQIEKLLEALELSTDPEASVYLVSVFAFRQASRLGRGDRTARLISQAISSLKSSTKAAAGLKEATRRTLGVAKWVYEAVERRRIPRVDASKATVDQLLKILAG